MLRSNAQFSTRSSGVTTDNLLIGNQVAVIGQGILRNNILLPALLGSTIMRWYPWYNYTKYQKIQEIPTSFVGWGQKKSYQRARKMAKKLNLPVFSIEDGFLRSIDSGIHSRYGCSIVIDDIGIYFNSHHPSKLEHDVAYRFENWSTDNELRAQNTIDKILDYRLSKYNATLSCPDLNTINPNNEHILLIDQVEGDASIKGAGAGRNQFVKMLKIACRNHPKAHIWIKAHPASRSGYLNSSKVISRLSKRQRNRISIIDSSVNPIALLEQVDHVYTVSSHMGFEALMLNKSVYCFGVSWYSGWGLTNDKYTPKKLLKKVIKRRCNSINSSTASVTLLQLFYAAYIDYSRYANPASKQACEIEQVITWLNTNRYWYLKLPSKLTVYEFSRWKTDFVNEFIQILKSNTDFNLKFKPKPKFQFLQPSNRLKVDLSHDVLVWGLAGRHKVQKGLNNLKKTASKGVDSLPNIWCMEDGFIRSNGLGATLLAPLSVVIDEQGIYYDATKPSDLEQIISQCPALTAPQLKRTQSLQSKLLKQRVSKYHVGRLTQLNIPKYVKDEHKSVILIVGQVEDDLSVQYCGSAIKTNSALIQRVKSDNPSAYLIYKPHPDVEAGLRAGKVDETVLSLVDKVAYDVAMPDCLDNVDEVHTISSLSGFEALLRGKKVSCYGLPFYAGWGLTADIDATKLPKSNFLARRQEARLKNLNQPSSLKSMSEFKQSITLTLEQLIYCTLIKYPLYRLPKGHGLAQVEQVIDYLYPTDKNQSQADSAQQITAKFMQARHFVKSSLKNNKS